VPKLLFCDNGSEFTSQAMNSWAYQNGVKIDFSRPGKPMGNAFVESFNGTFRAEYLNTVSIVTRSSRQPSTDAYVQPPEFSRQAIYYASQE